MASDSPGDASVSVNLPESLSHWLDDKASEEGRSREDVLLQLLSAYRKVDGIEGGDVNPPQSMVDGEGIPAELEELLDDRIEELVDDHIDRRLAEPDGTVEGDQLDRRLQDVESRFDGLLEDVRERVIQVKRETDQKAAADHDHPELASAVEELEGVADDLETVAAAVDKLETRMEGGFDNYEEVLEYLADTIDQVSRRQATLANAIVETREELRKLAARDSARSAVEELQRAAGQLGVRNADCEDCGTTVDLGLLTRTECPHCSASFVSVTPAQGYFGSDTIETGNRPALEAGDPDDDGFEYGVGEIVDTGEETAGADVRDDIADEADAADADDHGAAGDETGEDGSAPTDGDRTEADR
jgi:predicted Zn-ribbon and HTH transcriptional regulator